MVFSLGVVVEDCVNVVGVDVNIVLELLLVCIFGFNKIIVGNIVSFCNQNGVFGSWDDLK